MRKEQIKQVNKEIVNILQTDEYKNSASARHPEEIIKLAIWFMSKDKVCNITKDIIKEYFLSAFYGMEIPLQREEEADAYYESGGQVKLRYQTNID